jgi:predicted nucleic acid-binding protein
MSVRSFGAQIGCRVLLFEDFQDGSEIDGIRAVNPFLQGIS